MWTALSYKRSVKTILQWDVHALLHNAQHYRPSLRPTLTNIWGEMLHTFMTTFENNTTAFHWYIHFYNLYNKETIFFKLQWLDSIHLHEFLYYHTCILKMFSTQKIIFITKFWKYISKLYLHKIPYIRGFISLRWRGLTCVDIQPDLLLNCLEIVHTFQARRILISNQQDNALFTNKIWSSIK